MSLGCWCAELTLFEALEDTAATRGRFQLNAPLSSTFGSRAAEIDLLGREDRVAVEIDPRCVASSRLCRPAARERKPMTRVDEDRLADVVYACCAMVKTPRSMNEIQGSVARYRGAVSEPEWRAAVVVAVEGLQKSGRFEGRRAARGPGGNLVALALGAEIPRKVKNGLAAAIVGRELGLWTGGKLSAPALCDALVWRELGLRGKAKRVPPEMRAHFLRQKLREAHGDGDADRWLRQLAAQIVGAASTRRESLRDALVARWLASASAPEAEPAPPSFVDAVRDAAHRTHDGRFGDRQVFIVSVWRNLRSDPAFGDLSLDDFKRRLVEAHRSGELALVRADLVGVMDPALVADSEIQHHEARFHFLLEERCP